MRTYYEPGYGWLTVDDRGVSRAATAAEVQAAQAKAGSAATAGSTTPAGGTTLKGETAAPVAPIDAYGGKGGMAPDEEPRAWQTYQPWWGTLFPTDTLQRTAYDLDPSFAWATMDRQLGGNAWAPRYNWTQSQQQRYYDQYADENTRAQGAGVKSGGVNPNMTFADWIEANAPKFSHDFDMLPASQRGINNIWQPGGRQTF